MGRRISASSTHSCQSGADSIPEPAMGEGSSGKQLKTLVLEPFGHLGSLCLLGAVPQEPLRSWECGEAASGQYLGGWGEGRCSQPPLHTLLILLGRNPKKKADGDLGTEEKNPKCSHSYTESLWQREHLAALNIGVSPFYSTQAF